MSKTEKNIQHISSSDYARLFISNGPSALKVKNGQIQVYDYHILAQNAKVPTYLSRLDYYAVIHLTKGFLRAQLGTGTKKIGESSVLFISTGLIFKLLEISPDIEGTIVVFENSVLNNILSRQGLLKLFDINPVIQLDEQNNRIFALLNQIMLSEFDADKLDLEVFIPLLQAMFQKLLGLSYKNKVLSQSHLVALKFKELVYKYFTNEKSVAFFAKEMAITENYLNRCSKIIFNKSAKKFIMEVAILQSQLLLQDMGKNISEIANELNFEDPAYFTRIFKKITQITPSAYRQQLIRDLY
jgi:AraC family transcriptional activator of pobA